MNKKQIKIGKKRIEVLNKEIVKLKQELNKCHLKNCQNMGIRNLKIFGNACKFIAPFVLTAGITVGSFSLFGGGLPFKEDSITKYKFSHLEVSETTPVIIKEEYRTRTWMGPPLEPNRLTVISPWSMKEDGTFARTKREYKVNAININDLQEAIISKNISYIIENLARDKEEFETIKGVQGLSNQFIIEASLTNVDENIKIEVPETDDKNLIITIIECFLILTLGSYFTINQYSSIKSSIMTILTEYPITSTKELQKTLKKTKDEIRYYQKKENNNETKR